MVLIPVMDSSGFEIAKKNTKIVLTPDGGKGQIMRILAIDKYEEPVVKEIDNSLKDMQKYVMGYIETVTLSETATLVCNEDGKLAGFTPNRVLKIGKHQDVIRGDFFICGWSGDEFCDISDEDIEKYTKMFSKPEVSFMPVWAKASRVWKAVKPEEEKKTFCFYDLLQTEADYVFCPFESAMKRHSPKLSDYGKVYRGIFEFCDTFDAKRECEMLYMEHNGVILDRKGRSMSISDVIVMHLPNGDRYFYVDMFGFAEIKFDKNGKMMEAEKKVEKYKR